MSITTAMSGFMICMMDIPADFIASNSKFSPKLPIVMIAAKSITIGRPSGIMFVVAYAISSIMTPASRPFPVNSSMYRHTKFIIKTNMTMKNVTIRGPKYALSTNLCMVFIRIGRLKSLVVNDLRRRERIMILAEDTVIILQR